MILFQKGSQNTITNWSSNVKSEVCSVFGSDLKNGMWPCQMLFLLCPKLHEKGKTLLQSKDIGAEAVQTGATDRKQERASAETPERRASKPLRSLRRCGLSSHLSTFSPVKVASGLMPGGQRAAMASTSELLVLLQAPSAPSAGGHLPSWWPNANSPWC